jgi:cytochrome b561
MNPAIPDRKTAPARYTGVAIGLHWLMAIALVGSFSLGTYMHDLPFSPTKLKYFSWHKWAGVTIFAVLLLRLIWRLTHRPPALPAGMPRWQQLAATATHLALYGLMIAIPLSGWLMSSAKGFQTVWFGVLPIPDLLGKSESLGDLLRNVHEALNFLLALTVSAHVGAALKHHFVNRDDVLLRMLPRFRRPQP